MKLSVIISTRNRPDKIGDCLKAILTNSFPDFEIIVIDQSDDDKTKEIVKKISNKLIRYFKMVKKGLSKGRKLGVKKAKAEIVVFVDDDCLVDKNWLLNINNFLIRNKNIAGVFGQVLPFKPKEHPNQICPSTFYGAKKKIVNHPNIIHYRDLGLSNMALRKSLFNEVGYFKEWLGVGSVGMAAEESEFIYRILKKNYKLAFIPNMIFYHNRWLTSDQERILQGKYTCGLIAFYSYYLFKKEKIMTKFIFGRIKERVIEKLIPFLRKIKKLYFQYIFLNKKEPLFIIWEMICALRGFLIAVYFSFIGEKDEYFCLY